MKFLPLLTFLFSVSSFADFGNTGSVYVNGYYKSNGAYVSGYERSRPNDTETDNRGYRDSNSDYRTKSYNSPSYDLNSRQNNDSAVFIKRRGW